MTHLSGPGEATSANHTTVDNHYVDRQVNGQPDPFNGRLESSVSKRGTEILSQTDYNYSSGALKSAYLDLYTSLTTTTQAAGLKLEDTAHPANALWNGYATAWVEKQTVSSSSNGQPAKVSTTWQDALGQTFATASESGWQVSLPDAQGRIVFTFNSDRSWTKTTYDGAGLVLTSTSYNKASNKSSTTQYTYDSQGRQIEVKRDGKSEGRTVYGENPGGGRAVTSFDAAGNQTLTVTDAAGRTTQESFIGVKGAKRTTRYGYNKDGRRIRTEKDGLISESSYDDAGREKMTTQILEGRSYVTTRGYDRYGRQVWSQSPAQAAASCYTTYQYNTTVGVDDPAYGQLLKVVYNDNDKEPGCDAGYIGYYERYEYDAKGRQDKVFKPTQLVAGGDAVEVCTKTDFVETDGPAKGQPWHVTMDAEGTGANPAVFTFDYDDKGQRSKVIYPGGLVKTWTSQMAGETLTSQSESQVGPDGAAPLWKKTNYGPDGLQQSGVSGTVYQIK